MRVVLAASGPAHPRVRYPSPDEHEAAVRSERRHFSRCAASPRRSPVSRRSQDVTFSRRARRDPRHRGENGAGKSTLMKVLWVCTRTAPTRATSSSRARQSQFSDIRDSEAKGIVIIHQELALGPYLSIAENIFLDNEQATPRPDRLEQDQRRGGRRCSRASASTRTRRTHDHRHRRRQAAARRDRQGALQARRSCSSSTSRRPRSTTRTPTTCSTCILTSRTQGITSIIISHKLNEIEKVADTVTVIRDGKTIETHRQPEATSPKTASSEDMVGRDLEHRYPDRTTAHRRGDAARRGLDGPPPGTTGPRRRRQRVSLNVRAGEIVGIAGLMGAGRTEFAMSLFGRSYGTRHLAAGSSSDGKEIKTRTVAEADRATASPTPPRTARPTAST